jgi:UDP:flavonoid glycosyltransferase YjiC (YdhE family)
MGQPMRVIAIAKALQRRHHEVKFLAGGKLIPVIRNFGIDVIEINDMPQFDFPSNPMPNLDQQDELSIKIRQVMTRIMEIEKKIATQEKPSMLLCGTLSGPTVGQQLGIPTLLTFLQPHGLKTLAMFTQRLKNSKMKDPLSSMLAAANLIIVEGMPEISGGVTLGELGSAVAEVQDKIHFTGPLLIEDPDALPSRENLKEKYSGARDKQLVYVTIGGGSSLIGEQFLRIVLECLRMLPQLTGVVATGIAMPPDQIKSLNPPDNANIRGFVPGTELIKASDVTVFHGGSSTLMTCLACGTPAVVVPSMGEQEDNGAVLAQRGAGIVLDKPGLTPQLLVNAIKTIVSDSKYGEQAAKLKVLGEKYGGAERAASLVEQLVARGAVFQ